MLLSESAADKGCLTVVRAAMDMLPCCVEARRSFALTTRHVTSHVT